nr:PREDICTED: TBC1 domain family member 16 [Paralichthys olivaceus]
MSLGRLLRRASSKASDLLTFNPGAGGSSLRSGLDGEIIFSKNNVCVHPTEPLPGLAEHHPGYLCVHVEKDESLGTTLILTWVPNSRIQKQDEEALRYITPESSPVRRNARHRGRRPHSRHPAAQEEDEDEERNITSSTSTESHNLVVEAGADASSHQQQLPLAVEEGDEGSCELSDEVSRDSTMGSDSDTFSSPFCLSPVSEALCESSGSVFLDNETSLLLFHSLVCGVIHETESTFENTPFFAERVCSPPTLQQAIFFGGIDPSIRGEVWPFLLHYYSYDSTSQEREAWRLQKRTHYHDIQQRRLSMSPEEHSEFWRKVQFTVDKDVVRTDRSNHFFRGENNPNVEIMRRILLNYAVFNPDMGYCQGMSDLVAPLLTEIQDESDTFWCFVGLMENTIFISSPRDEDMERQLMYLRELLRLMLPHFHQHLTRLGEDGLQLLFCHRWILLCFKREFPDTEALRMWEACWAHYQTDYFHLFLCVAIIVLYGEDVTEQQLATDQMLLHFSNLSMHMNGELVLRKARSLLYQFRLLPRIPCSLHDLCKLCGPGMWDSRYIPTVECSGEHPDSQSCPYGGTSTPQPSSPSPSSTPSPSPNPTPTPPAEGKRGSKTREIFTFRKQS